MQSFHKTGAESCWLLHSVWYLNFRYPAANLKLSAEDLDIRLRVWVWTWGLVYKYSADVLGIRYPAEGFIFYLFFYLFKSLFTVGIDVSQS